MRDQNGEYGYYYPPHLCQKCGFWARLRGSLFCKKGGCKTMKCECGYPFMATTTDRKKGYCSRATCVRRENPYAKQRKCSKCKARTWNKELCENCQQLANNPAPVPISSYNTYTYYQSNYSMPQSQVSASTVGTQLTYQHLQNVWKANVYPTSPPQQEQWPKPEISNKVISIEAWRSYKLDIDIEFETCYLMGIRVTWEGRELTAQCYGNMYASEYDSCSNHLRQAICSCGIYAAKEEHKASLDYAISSGYDVLAKVSLGGIVLESEYGYRASKARIEQIYVSGLSNYWNTEFIKQELEQRYEVPVYFQ